ncbi:ABC transporter substrate-binding protein [uncultured Thiodictyon sp.]|uniref:ABC transporter substrate-binding protein n=1 Tax=uncultured Thiodictyon sp. TaxID=1846217 RepID=UPI0025E4009E|nr:ABC transporter substrate-binding protein [uncultured Thiodictyon sp.]
MKKIALWSALLAILAASLLLWRQWRLPPPIPVGVVAWLASAAVVGSSEMNAADLFLEEHPLSRIRVRPVDDQWQADKTVPAIAAAMGEGVRFFVSTHPSKCAVASIQLFADSRALLINTASTSPALTGKDDYFLRIVADAPQEQRAIARYVDQLPGTRILVLQDEGNLPYTDPAFQAFSAELQSRGQWQIVHRPLMVANFNPDEFHSIMAEPYDALYILAGSFQAAIGNIAQLFHHLHPAAPILLTPWARSPAILETAGPAIDRIILPSQYPARRDAPAIDAYFRRFHARFGYQPHAMTIGVWQALELLDQSFSRGYDTPAQVKHYLLSLPIYQTSLGPIAFDPNGDVSRTFYFIQDLKQELQ